MKVMTLLMVSGEWQALLVAMYPCFKPISKVMFLNTLEKIMYFSVCISGLHILNNNVRKCKCVLHTYWFACYIYQYAYILVCVLYIFVHAIHIYYTYIFIMHINVLYIKGVVCRYSL